jgi:hypothetical protein
MAMTPFQVLLLLILRTLLLAQPASGQSTRAEYDPHRCRVATEIVRTGDSRAYSRAAFGAPEEQKQGWAYSVIRTCRASGASVLAARINAMRNSRDPDALQAVTFPTRDFHDGNLFQTARSIAGDAGASPEARVFAFRTLMWSIEPRLTLRYEDLRAGRGRCIQGVTLHWEEPWKGTPMPRGHRKQVEELSQTVIAMSSTPTQVRNAAGCALLEARK